MSEMTATRTRRTLAQRLAVLAAASGSSPPAPALADRGARTSRCPTSIRGAYLHGRRARPDRRYRRVSRRSDLGVLARARSSCSRSARLEGAAADARGCDASAAGGSASGVLVGLAVVVAVWLSRLPFGRRSLWWQPPLRAQRTGLGRVAARPWLTPLAARARAGVDRGRAALCCSPGASAGAGGSPAAPRSSRSRRRLHPRCSRSSSSRSSTASSPLRDRALAARDRGARARGWAWTSDDVEVADASRRTTTANAYVAGLGPTTRVVIWRHAARRPLHGRRDPRSSSRTSSATSQRRHLWKGLGWFAAASPCPASFLLARLTTAARRPGEPGARAARAR